MLTDDVPLFDSLFLLERFGQPVVEVPVFFAEDGPDEKDLFAVPHVLLVVLFLMDLSEGQAVKKFTSFQKDCFQRADQQ